MKATITVSKEDYLKAILESESEGQAVQPVTLARGTLADMKKIGKVAVTSYFGSETWVKAHHAVIKRFLVAMRKSQDDLNAHPAIYHRDLVKYFHMKPAFAAKVPLDAFLRAIETDEIPGIISEYRHAAENAKRAGFDGVELHGANGYLLDQFLQDSTNTRTDQYGGSIANRARLLLEVTDAVIEVWGADRVGVHLSPRADMHDMGDSHRAALFTHVARELGQRKIAFIAAREHQASDSIGPNLKAEFGGVYIANESFTRESAEAAIADGIADAVAFGKLFIANPDLPERFAADLPLNPPDPSTFYQGGAGGYTDYPTAAVAA